MTRHLEKTPTIYLGFVGMDEKGGRAGWPLVWGCLLLAPLCSMEEKACVKWGLLLGSQTYPPRRSHVPFGSWGLLATNLYQDITYTF